MKKTYIAPTCEVVKLNAADIIATSFGVNTDKPTTEQLGREGFWEDEDW